MKDDVNSGKFRNRGLPVKNLGGIYNPPNPLAPGCPVITASRNAGVESRVSCFELELPHLRVDAGGRGAEVVRDGVEGGQILHVVERELANDGKGIR